MFWNSNWTGLVFIVLADVTKWYDFWQASWAGHSHDVFRFILKCPLVAVVTCCTTQPITTFRLRSLRCGETLSFVKFVLQLAASGSITFPFQVFAISNVLNVSNVLIFSHRLKFKINQNCTIYFWIIKMWCKNVWKMC